MYEQEYWFSNIVIQWTVFRCEDTFEWTSFEYRFSNIRQWSDKLYSILLSSTSSLLSYGDIRILWTSFKYYSLKISSMLWFKKYSIMSSLSYESYQYVSNVINIDILLWEYFHLNKLWFSNIAICWMLQYEKYSIMSLLSYEQALNIVNVVARQIFDYELAFIWIL